MLFRSRIEVSFDAGPWIGVGQVTGRDLEWRGFSSDLAARAAGAASLQVRFNATSDVLSQSGGWWVDDVLVSPANLGHAVAVLPVIADRSIEPGAVATFILKTVNIGDLDDTFAFSTTLPAGWTAKLGGNSSAAIEVSQVRVPLAPNGEATLQLQLTSPPGVVRGTVATVPLVARSMAVPAAAATFNATARINDPIGLGTLTRYAPYLAGVLVVLGVIAFAIDSHKRRKFHARLR